MSEPVVTVEDPMLTSVKKALNIGGTYQDDALTEYINEVKAFLRAAGVSDANMTPGLVARGVADLWQYGAGEGKLSEFRSIVEEEAALIASPYLHYVNGLSLLGGARWLSGDFVHPTQAGADEIAKNLIREMEKYIER